MYRRYKPRRKTSSHAIPLTAIGLTAAALLLWGIYAKGSDIYHFFEGKTVVVADNSEANANLERLMADLSGDKPRLLELAGNEKTRLGWIKDVNTRRQFRWFLLCRLIDMGQWDEAVRILPEVETLAPMEGLDRIAEAARQHEDYELQLRLDRELQDKAVQSPEQTALLLRSIRRTVETCIRMNRKDDAAAVILSRLGTPAVMARLTSPELAAEAAELQMLCADLSVVKEPVLQMVRNTLEKAKWPLCPATSRLMLEEVCNTLRDNPNLSQTALREIESKLLHCRDSLLEYPDREHRLPKCYMMLGELRFRLSNYDGCVQALALASAFAEGYGEMTPEFQVKLSRVRSLANEARGAVEEAKVDYRYLLEHEADQKEIFRFLTYLASHSEGEERMALLTRCWDMLSKDEKLALTDTMNRESIAKELAAYYAEKQDFPNAIRWGGECLRMIEAAHPDLTDGKALRARLNNALLIRKAQQDLTALRQIRDVVRAIDGMSDDENEKLKAADAKLYKDAVREFARSHLLMGDRTTAQSLVKKIRESLPEKVR